MSLFGLQSTTHINDAVPGQKKATWENKHVFYFGGLTLRSTLVQYLVFHLSSYLFFLTDLTVLL